MEPSSLSSLVVELFAAIRILSGYPSPEVLPSVHVVPAAEIQQKICDGRSCAIKAFYHPEWGIYIDQRLDLRNDAFDRSILLHELVHHLQRTTGKFESVASVCIRRTAEEAEAYEIQNRYLAGVGARRRALVAGWSGKCQEP